MNDEQCAHLIYQIICGILRYVADWLPILIKKTDLLRNIGCYITVAHMQKELRKKIDFLKNAKKSNFKNVVGSI
jgi:hypothetical protein